MRASRTALERNRRILRLNLALSNRALRIKTRNLVAIQNRRRIRWLCRRKRSNKRISFIFNIAVIVILIAKSLLLGHFSCEDHVRLSEWLESSTSSAFGIEHKVLSTYFILLIRSRLALALLALLLRGPLLLNRLCHIEQWLLCLSDLVLHLCHSRCKTARKFFLELRRIKLNIRKIVTGTISGHLLNPPILTLFKPRHSHLLFCCFGFIHL